MKITHLGITALLVSLGCAMTTRAQEAIDAALQAKVDAKIKEAQAWAADPVILKAVKTHNEGLSPEEVAMTQDKWKVASVLEPFVRSFTKNEAATFLKTKQGATVSEAFLSGADGRKVAFLAKTTNWSHQGKPKHDVPMTGKIWQGPVEMDESSGQRQLQIAVPVLDSGKPIGSLVVGLNVFKLAKE